MANKRVMRTIHHRNGDNSIEAIDNGIAIMSENS